jgi:hypothetical protein
MKARGITAPLTAKLLSVDSLATGELSNEFRSEYYMSIPKGNRTVIILTLLTAELMPVQAIVSYGSKRKVRLLGMIGKQIDIEPEDFSGQSNEKLPLFTMENDDAGDIGTISDSSPESQQNVDNGCGNE